jgi:HAD superfamily hydrolase (TIGR01509 family)
MYDHIIYDFDGTISDTYPVFTKALLILLNQHGIKADYDTVYRQLKVSVSYALGQYDLKGDVKKEYEDIHRKIALAEQKAFPEAEGILKYAISLGKKNYLYTHSGTIVYELLKNMGISDCFEFILDSTTYDFPRKPAPDALNYLIDKFGIDRSSALMVGDRDIDTDAAKNAGIKGCLIDPEGFYPGCVTEHYIKSLDELKKII